MNPASVTILTGSITALFIFLLLVERTRNTRYLRPMRVLLDQLFDVISQRIRDAIPRIDSGFVRSFFHYVTHVLLSMVLRVLQQLESLLRKIAQFNRSKAREAENTAKSNSNSHLQKIAAHKEAVSLTSAEMEKRKQDALTGE